MISIFKLSSSFWNGDFHDCFQRGYEEKRASVGANEGAKNASFHQRLPLKISYGFLIFCFSRSTPYSVLRTTRSVVGTVDT